MAYPTSLSQYGQECVDEELTIEKRASKLIKDLNQLDLSKPTIFVGHSMGGLLIKSIITQGKYPIHGPSTECPGFRRSKQNDEIQIFSFQSTRLRIYN